MDGAEGNPFYMEEIVGMLIDDQVIIAVDGRWRVVPERLVGFRVPPTLAGVLQARVDALSGSAKSCLQAASVVGAVFWDEAVAQIDPDIFAIVEQDIASIIEAVPDDSAYAEKWALPKIGSDLAYGTT